MVRETRHLWVGNLPENISEDRIREHFKRYGPVQSVKFVSGAGDDGLCAAVAFVDICSAAKARKADHRLEERLLKTTYYEPSLTALTVSHYPSTGSRDSPHYTPAPTHPHGVLSPRFSSGLNEDQTSYDHSSHFYESRRDENIGYNGPESGSSAGIRRAYPGDRDSDFSAAGRGRVRAYPPRGHFLTNGRAEPGEYRWTSGGQYRYQTEGYPEEKIRRSQGASPPPISRSSHQSVSFGKRRLRTSRSGSGSPSSSRSISSSRSSSSRSSSSHSISLRRSSRSNSRSPSCRVGNASQLLSIPINSSPGEKRPLAICVKNLPPWSSDNSLKDGLFHDYKKHGKVTLVRIFGTGSDRYAVVCFKKPEDAEKALHASQEKQFFGVKIQVSSHEGLELDENEFRAAYDAELDEYHRKATRTLFIGGLDKDVTASELRTHFEGFGEIIEIDIKKQNSSTFAFCQYSDIRSVVQAVKKMDGEYLGSNRIKLGFGKSMPNRCIWVGGISESLTDALLCEQFGRYGSITHRSINRDKGYALIAFESERQASSAVTEMRGCTVNGKRLQIDFASRECQESFFDNIKKQEFSSPRRDAEKTDRPKRESAYVSRQVSTQRPYSSSRSRSRYEAYDDGRLFDEYVDDSFERDLHEYAGRQRYENGPTSSHNSTSSNGTSNTKNRGLSPLRKREERSPHSPLSGAREPEGESPHTRPYAESEGRKSLRHESASDQGSFHSLSPPPPAKLSSPTRRKTSSRMPSHSPSTPCASSPSREVTLMEDRSLPDLRRRRPSDYKDLVVRVSDLRRPSESPIGSRSNHRIHSDTDETESFSGKMELLDPRLIRRDETISSGDERSIDSDRQSKKSKFTDVSLFEKSKVIRHSVENCEYRTKDHSPNFRKPYESLKNVDRLKKEFSHSSSVVEDVKSPPSDPRQRKPSHSGSSDVDESSSWRSRDIPCGPLMCDAEFLSDISPPGTPVRDEREEPTSESTSRRPHPPTQRVPMSLPLPKFAQQMRIHLSPRGSSASPRAGGLLRSPTFNTGTNWNPPPLEIDRGIEEVDPILADTPVSPGPAVPDIPSDSEKSATNVTPHNATIDLDERIKALDEKYEKWTGSARSFGKMSNTHKIKSSSERHGKASTEAKKKIKDIEELRSQEPSAIVKSLLSKRSVFDEDSERLENVGDKYEPKPFASVSSLTIHSLSSNVSNLHPSNLVTSPATVPLATPLSSLPGIRVTRPCMSSPPHIIKSTLASSVTTSISSLTSVSSHQYKLAKSSILNSVDSSVQNSSVTHSLVSTTAPSVVHARRLSAGSSTSPSSDVKKVKLTDKQNETVTTVALETQATVTNPVVQSLQTKVSVSYSTHDPKPAAMYISEYPPTSTVSPSVVSSVMAKPQTISTTTQTSISKAKSQEANCQPPTKQVNSSTLITDSKVGLNEKLKGPLESSLTVVEIKTSLENCSGVTNNTSQGTNDNLNNTSVVSVKPTVEKSESLLAKVKVEPLIPLLAEPEKLQNGHKRRQSCPEELPPPERRKSKDDKGVEPESKKIKVEPPERKDCHSKLMKEVTEKKDQRVQMIGDHRKSSDECLHGKEAPKKVSEDKGGLEALKTPSHMKQERVAAKVEVKEDKKDREKQKDKSEDKEKGGSRSLQKVLEKKCDDRKEVKTEDKREVNNEEKKEVVVDEKKKESKLRKERSKDRKEKSRDRDKRSKSERDGERERKSSSHSDKTKSKERERHKSSHHHSERKKESTFTEQSASNIPDDKSNKKSYSKPGKHQPSTENDYAADSSGCSPKFTKTHLSLSKVREDVNKGENEIHEKNTKDGIHKKSKSGKDDKSGDASSSRKSQHKGKPNDKASKKIGDGSSDDDTKGKSLPHPAKRTNQRATSSSSGSRRGRPSKKLAVGSESDSDDHESDSESQKPKKPSYFDIDIYDGNMYDKVKARRVKALEKQEEELKQLEMKTKLLQQRSKRAKKASGFGNWESDESDTEHPKKRRNARINSSSDEDEFTKLCLNHMSSDESDSNIKQRKMDSSKKKLAPTDKAKGLHISDVSDDEPPIKNMSGSESDSEPLRLRRESGKVNYDSDGSDAGVPKPPRPALSVSRGRMKEKDIQMQRASKSASTVTPVEGSKHKCGRHEASESVTVEGSKHKCGRHEASESVSSKSQKGKLSETSLKERKEGRMKAIFGLMSDDSDSNAPSVVSAGDLASATSYRKASSSSGASSDLRSPNQSRSHCLYESDVDDDFRPPTPDIKLTSSSNLTVSIGKDAKYSKTLMLSSPVSKDVCEASRAASDSGKGSSGVSTASSGSGSSPEELLLLETSSSSTFKDDVKTEKAQKPFCFNKALDTSNEIPQNDKKKKKKHKDKDSRSHHHCKDDEDSLKKSNFAFNRMDKNQRKELDVKLDTFNARIDCEIDPGKPFSTLDIKSSNGHPKGDFIKSTQEPKALKRIIGSDSEPAINSLDRKQDQSSEIEELSEIEAVSHHQKPSRSTISQEETLNAVAGLLACYNEYKESVSPSQTDEEHLAQSETSGTTDDPSEQSEEAQKAALLLQSEMPEDRESEQEQPWQMNESHLHSFSEEFQRVTSADNRKIVTSNENIREVVSRRKNLNVPTLHTTKEPTTIQFPDSPSSVQSEPVLQIDEDDQNEATCLEDKIRRHISAVFNDATCLPISDDHSENVIHNQSLTPQSLSPVLAPSEGKVDDSFDKFKINEHLDSKFELTVNYAINENNLNYKLSETVGLGEVEAVKKDNLEAISGTESDIKESVGKSAPDDFQTATEETVADDFQTATEVALSTKDREPISAGDLKEIPDAEKTETDEGNQDQKTRTLHRGRGRGRGKRGGSVRSNEVPPYPETPMLTRSSINSRHSKARGRGRISLSSDRGEKITEQLRRSTRTKKATKHPDMVEHDETSSRRKRGGAKGPRGSEDLRSSHSSSIYDFHDSDDDAGVAVSKKGKKDVGRQVAPHSPSRTEENVDVVGDLSPRKSRRLKEKVSDDDTVQSDGEIKEEMYANTRVQGKGNSEIEGSTNTFRGLQSDNKVLDAEQKIDAIVHQPPKALIISCPPSKPIITSATIQSPITPVPPLTPAYNSSSHPVKLSIVQPNVHGVPKGTAVSCVVTQVPSLPISHSARGDYGSNPLKTAIPEIRNFSASQFKTFPNGKKPEMIPTPLVDPVTGHLTPMKISDEGHYIPIPREQSPIAARISAEEKLTQPSSQAKFVRAVIPSNITVTCLNNSNQTNIVSKPSSTVVATNRQLVATNPKSMPLTALTRGSEVSVELVSRTKPAPTPSDVQMTAVKGISGFISKPQISSHSSGNPVITSHIPASQITSSSIITMTAQGAQGKITSNALVGNGGGVGASRGPVLEVSLTQVKGPVGAKASTVPSSTKTIANSQPGANSQGVILSGGSIPSSSSVGTLTVQRINAGPDYLGPPVSTSPLQMPMTNIVTRGLVHPQQVPPHHAQVIEERTSPMIFVEGHRGPRQEFVSLSGPHRYPDPRYPREAPPDGARSPALLTHRHYDTTLPGGATNSETRSTPGGSISHLQHPINAKGGLGHFYPSRDLVESGKATAVSHGPLQPGAERYLTSPPLCTPPSVHSPPPAHLNAQRDSLPVNPIVYHRGPYIVSDPIAVPVYADKMGGVTQMPIDLKIIEKSHMGERDEKDQRPPSGSLQYSEMGSAPRPQTILAPLGSPHHLSPLGDRTTDSPQVTMMYARRYPPHYESNLYPSRSGTPGLEHDTLSHSPIPYATLAGDTHHQGRLQIPPQYASPLPQTDYILQDYPIMWDGMLGLKNDQALVKMHFVSGSVEVARGALSGLPDAATSLMKISQRMRLEQSQLDGVARKMQMEAEHSILMALPYGRTPYEMLQQQVSLDSGFIKYLGEKRAAGIVNVFGPGSQQSAYVIHIFPPCEFANKSLARIAPELLHGISNMSRLLVIIATC